MPSALDSLLAASQGWGVKKRPPPPAIPDRRIPYQAPISIGHEDIDALSDEAASLGSDTERLIASFGQTPIPPPKPPTVDDLYSGETPPLPPRPASLGPHGILGPRPLPMPEPPEEPEAPSFYGNENVGRPEAQPRKPTFMEELANSPIGDNTLIPIRDRAIEALPQSIRTLYETAKAKAGELVDPIKRVVGYPLRAFANIGDTANNLPIALGEAISGQPMPGHAHAPGASLDEILVEHEAQIGRNLSGEGESVPMKSRGFLEAALGRNPTEQFRASGPLDSLIAQMTGAPVPKAGEMVRTPAIERILKNAGLQTADTALGMATDPGIPMMLAAGAGGGIGRKALDLAFQYEGAKGLVRGVGAATEPTPEGVDPREASIEKWSNVLGAIGGAGVFFGPSVVPALRGKAAEVRAVRDARRQGTTEDLQDFFGKTVSDRTQAEINKSFPEGEAPTSESKWLRPRDRAAMLADAQKLIDASPTPVPPKPEGWERKAWSPENAEPMPPGAAKYIARDEIAAAAAKKKSADVAAASLANEGKRPPKPVDPRQLKLLEELKAEKTKASLEKNYPRVKELTKKIEEVAGEQPVFPEAEPFVFESPTQPKGGAETQLPLKPGGESPPPPAPAAPPPARPTTIEEMLNGPVTSAKPAPPPAAIVPETRVAKGITQPGLPVEPESTAPVQRRYTPEPAPAPPVEAKPQTVEELIAQVMGGKPEPKVEVVEPGKGTQANASGVEQGAGTSVEAEGRFKVQKFGIVDRGGNVRPLVDATGVDAKPSANEAKVIIKPDGSYEFVEGNQQAFGAIKKPAGESVIDGLAADRKREAERGQPPPSGREGIIAEWMAKGMSREEAEARLNGTFQPAAAPEAPKVAPPVAQAKDTVVTQPEGVTRATNVYDINDTSKVGIDAKTYQVKESDAKGVTGRLAGVTEWEENSPPVIIHERADGSMWVADGHQRFNKYQELKAQGKDLPPLRARIWRESEGWTVDKVVRYASRLNIMEGSVKPLDIARLLRTGPLTDLERATIAKSATTGAALTHGEGLAKLGEEAWQAVRNGEAEPMAVSSVEKYFTDPLEQLAAVRMVGKKGIKRAADGEAYVASLRDEMLQRKEADAQIRLPGLEGDVQFADLSDIRAKLMTRMNRYLIERKAAFANALKRKPILEEAKFSMDEATGKTLGEEAGNLLGYFRKYADQAGTATNAELRALTRELYAKSITPDAAADRLSAAIRRDIESGGDGGTAVAAPTAPSGRPGGLGSDANVAGRPEAVPPVQAEPTATVAEAQEILRKGAEATAKDAPPLADIPLTLTGEKATEGMGEPTKKELEAAGQKDMFAESAAAAPDFASLPQPRVPNLYTDSRVTEVNTKRQGNILEFRQTEDGRNVYKVQWDDGTSSWADALTVYEPKRNPAAPNPEDLPPLPKTEAQIKAEAENPQLETWGADRPENIRGTGAKLLAELEREISVGNDEAIPRLRARLPEAITEAEFDRTVEKYKQKWRVPRERMGKPAETAPAPPFDMPRFRRLESVEDKGNRKPYTPLTPEEMTALEASGDVRKGKLTEQGRSAYNTLKREAEEWRLSEGNRLDAEADAAFNARLLAEQPKPPEPPKFEAPKKPESIDEAITQAPRTYRDSTPEEYQAMSRARNAAIDAATQRGTDLLKKVRASKAKAEGLFEEGGAQAVIDYWNKVTAEVEKRPVTNENWMPPERIADNAELIAPPAKDFVIVRFEGRATPEQSRELGAAGFKFKEGEWIGNVEGPTNRVGRPREDLIADAKRIATGGAVRPSEPTGKAPEPVPNAAIPATGSSTSSPVQPPVKAPKPAEFAGDTMYEEMRRMSSEDLRAGIARAKKTPPANVKEYELAQRDIRMAEAALAEKGEPVEAPKAEPTKAAVKMMLTGDERQQLADLGFSRADIDAMKPDEGAAILAAGTTKPRPTPTVEEVVKKPTLDTAQEQTVISEAAQTKIGEAIEKLPDEPAPKKELDTLLEGKQDIYDQLPANVRSYLTKRAELSREDINNFGSVEEAQEYGQRFGANERAKAEAAKQEAARAAAGQPKKLTPIEDLANPKEPLEPKVEQWAKLIEADARGEQVVDREQYGDFFRDRADAIRKAQAIQAEMEKIQKEGALPVGEAKQGAIFGPDAIKEAQELADRYKAQSGEGAVVGEREMMRQAREREALIANGSPLALRRYGEFLQKVAARLNEKTLRGGTGKENKPVIRDEGGEIIGSGFGALEGMVTLAKKNPAAFKRIMAAAGVGGLIGASQNEEDRVMGFLMGAAAGATAGALLPASKAQAAKWKSAAEKLRLAGREPGNMALRREPNAARDLKLWEVLLPLNPETVVPEAYRKATRIMDELNNEMAYGKLAGEERSTQKSVSGDYVKEAVRTLRELAKEATDAGLSKKGLYISRMADALAKKPTKGQLASMEFAKTVGLDKLVEKAGGKLGYDWIERGLGITTYRVLTGYALDTALQNLTQPVLALRHVSHADLLWAYKVSRTQWAKDMTRHIHLIRPTDLEETSPGVTETTDVSGKSTAMDWVKDPQRLIAKSDNYNRRVVYLAAMRAAERNGLMGAYAKEWARAVNEQTFTEAYRTEADQWARSVMRDTQGDIGPLSVNPLYRGPIGGSLRPFTKFPTLLFRNLLDVAFQPDATGRNRFVMATAAAVFLGKQLGLDLEDTLLMGGRPFGMNVLNPAESLKKLMALDTFPVAKGAKDVWGHLAAQAGGQPMNHPVLPTSLDDFFNSDFSYGTLGRYGTKVGSFVKRTIDEGTGDRVVRTPSGATKDLTMLEDLLSLSGFKASRPNQLAKATSEASGEMYQGAADRKAKSKEIVRQIRVAHDAHDEERVDTLKAELFAVTKSSKAVINALQGIDRSQWERMLKQADPRTRKILIEKYADTIEALSIGK